MNTTRLLAALPFVFLATAAAAIPAVDQEAPYGTDTIVAGETGTQNRIVAQTVTAGLTGPLIRVELGVGCTSGALIVEIRRLEPGRPLPGSEVLSTTTIDAAELPDPPAIRTIDLARNVPMSAGDQYAIVLRNETGTCTLLKGAEALDGSSYPDGEGFFQSEAGPDDAWFQFLDFGKTGDLGFRTIVNFTRGSPPCTVNGSPIDFIASWVPVCRCLEDDGLRDFRCALMNPEYFAFRNIPFPIRAGKAFPVKWTLVVQAPMKGVVEIHDQLPPGFTGPKAPLTFFVGQVPVGQSLTLSYEAIAPLKPGKYKVETDFGQGTMRTVFEVVP